MNTHVPSPSNHVPPINHPSPALQPPSSQNHLSNHPSTQIHPSPTPLIPLNSSSESPSIEMPPPRKKDPPQQPKKRSPEPIENPHPKRPRETPKSKRKLTWFHTIRDAWSILENDFPGRHQFRPREILKVVDTNWHQLRGEEKKHKAWRNNITRAIRKEAMLTRMDGQSDFYAMKDPEYTPPPSRPSKKSPAPETDSVQEDAVYHPSIPPEWTNEPFKPVRISTFDKSSSLQFINSDPNTIKGHKGYRMARATAGVMEGDWYFEATVIQLRDPKDTEDGAVRLGWSQRRSDVETPVGFDTYGFGLRDRTGEFIHAARLKPYGQPFRVGDVIGCRISLPELNEEQKATVNEADRKWLTHRFISMLQGQAPPDSGIDIIKDGMVQFYKNGVAMGVPSYFEDGKKAALLAANEQTDSRDLPGGFQQRKGKSNSKEKTDSTSKENLQDGPKPSTVPKREMKAGIYYPSIALYGNSIVQANFGPNFQHSLPEGTRPMCDAVREAPPVVEQTPPVLEQEVIEIVDEPSSNPSGAALKPSVPSPPPSQTQSRPSALGEGEQALTEENATLEQEVRDEKDASLERPDATEETSDERTNADVVDSGEDGSREEDGQSQPEPMAIQA